MVVVVAVAVAVMNVDWLVEWELAGETKVFVENLPQCHFAHHKFEIT
jgi:hypothetical protein